uniref:Uncharacterized protein n=1 Tax=Caenorhabditis tropicalis TaxID=1561998 RepID=A0A1I7TL35_9PELO
MFSDSSAFSNLPEFKPFCGKDAELSRISCINGSEHEYLLYETGRANDFEYTRRLMKDSLTVIGMQESRKALNFPPPPSWTSLNTSYPFDEEIDEARTLEAYYELVEQQIIVRHLNIEDFFEHNISRGIEFLDNRNPVIREVFTCRFGNMVSREIDRKTIDRMISELYYFTIKGLLYDGIEEQMASSECYSKFIPDNNF